MVQKYIDTYGEQYNGEKRRIFIEQQGQATNDLDGFYHWIKIPNSLNCIFKCSYPACMMWFIGDEVQEIIQPEDQVDKSQ